MKKQCKGYLDIDWFVSITHPILEIFTQDFTGTLASYFCFVSVKSVQVMVGLLSSGGRRTVDISLVELVGMLKVMKLNILCCLTDSSPNIKAAY